MPSARDARRRRWPSSSRSSAPPAADLLPLLVIVTGPPAAGKTTLARQLARELRLTLVAKDDIKERLADADPPADREASRALGARAYAVLFGTAAALLAQGIGCLLESNFSPGRDEPHFRSLVSASRASLVCCEAPRAVLVRRYRSRVVARERHRMHFDELALAELERGIFADHGPLDLAIPTLRVDTAEGLSPPFAEIVSFVLASSQDS